jgi:hypothetical protein
VAMTGHNYVPVFEQPDDDTVIVEWDIAVSQEDVTTFTGTAWRSPGGVQVAPYRLYPRSTALPNPV